MARKYDSRRRTEHAAQTRLAIVEAAVKMHGEGVYAMNAIAEEAGVSLPTVNKYFPTREALFGACTKHLFHTLVFLSPAELAAITDRGERLYTAVRNIYTIHERTFGQMWGAYELEEESPTMARVLRDQDEYLKMLMDAVLTPDDDAAAAGFMRALLSTLTYRALRLEGGLDFEAAVAQTTRTLAKLIGISAPQTLMQPDDNRIAVAVPN